MKLLLRPSPVLRQWLLNQYVAFWSGPGAPGAEVGNTSLITVAVRMGDKILENSFIPVSMYVESVHTLVKKHGIRNPVVSASAAVRTQWVAGGVHAHKQR